MTTMIALAIIFAFGIAVAPASAESTAELGKQAPNFTLTDSKGITHNLSDFKGKYVVLEWINFDCPFVKKHYDGDNMQNLLKAYRDKGVVWLSICSSAPEKQGNFDNAEINKRIASLKANMNAYLIDADGKVGKMYGAKTTPNMYVISPSGELIYAGAIDSIKSTDKEDVAKAENYIKSALDEAMSGKAIKTKSTQPYGCSVKY